MYLIFSYAFCFTIVTILWAQHHFIFDGIYREGRKRISTLTLLLNGNFCIVVSMLPFACNLMTEYAIKPYTKANEGPLFTYAKYAEILHPDTDAGRTACLFATTLLFLASSILVGLLIEQQSSTTTNLVLIRFLSTPITTFIAMILLGIGVEGVLYKPLLFIPPVQFIVSAVEVCLERGKVNIRRGPSSTSDDEIAEAHSRSPLLSFR